MASSNFALVCGPSLVTKIPNQIMASSPDINIDPSNVYIDLSDLTDALQKGVSRIYDELNIIKNNLDRQQTQKENKTEEKVLSTKVEPINIKNEQQQPEQLTDQ